MPEYLRQLAEELRECAASRKGVDVLRLIAILAEELGRLSPEGFAPDGRAEFLKLRYSLKRWAAKKALKSRQYKRIEKLAGKIHRILGKIRPTESGGRTPAGAPATGGPPNYFKKFKEWVFSQKWLVTIIVMVVVLSSLLGIVESIRKFWRPETPRPSRDGPNKTSASPIDKSQAKEIGELNEEHSGPKEWHKRIARGYVNLGLAYWKGGDLYHKGWLVKLSGKGGSQSFDAAHDEYPGADS